MISTWLSAVLQVITGDLTRALSEAYRAKKEADTDESRLAAEERIKKLQARQDVILSAQGDPIERFVRIGFAAPFVIYLWKVVVWDKVLKLGVTDPLSAELSTLMGVVLAGYFVDTVVRRVFRR